MRRITLLAGSLLLLLHVPSRAEAVDLQSIGPGFNQPVFVTSPPGDPRLFVVELPGRIQVLHDGTVSQFLDISARTTTDGERGLLSMAFDPNYATNGLFYVFYTGDGVDAGGAPGDIHIDEYRVGSNPNAADASSRRTVWTFSHAASNHNGGQLQFGKDGLLYISVGDNATGANAQSVGNPYGKVLRIDPHGASPGAHGVPADNPLTGTPGATGEIWSLGLRNPYRFSFDHLSGDLVIADVGSSGPGVAEEIDFAPTSAGLARGVNFGWPACEGSAGSCPGATAPVFAYPHTNPGGDAAYGCAIIGGYVYRGTRSPELAGRYLYADLCTAQLRSIQLASPLASGDRSESTPGALTAARSFGEDSACNLYVMNTTTVFRVVGSASSLAPGCQATPAKNRKCKKRKKRGRHSLAAVRSTAGPAASEAAKKKKRCNRQKRLPASGSFEIFRPR
jgi:glucose/arabinose dehydrogenase